uniref:Uncharacterized protein n=1 Tax=Strongyloides papillosus TaxID=174720 RepID=A0A0N5CE73_STREA
MDICAKLLTLITLAKFKKDTNKRITYHQISRLMMDQRKSNSAVLPTNILNVYQFFDYSTQSSQDFEMPIIESMEINNKEYVNDLITNKETFKSTVPEISCKRTMEHNFFKKIQYQLAMYQLKKEN